MTMINYRKAEVDSSSGVNYGVYAKALCAFWKSESHTPDIARFVPNYVEKRRGDIECLIMISCYFQQIMKLTM